MRCLILISFLLFAAVHNSSAVERTCEIAGVSDQEWLTGYHFENGVEKKVDMTVASLKTKNVFGIFGDTSGPIIPSYNSETSKLTFTTTKDILNTPLNQIIVHILVSCEDNTFGTIRFIFDITKSFGKQDKECHNPQFAKPLYFATYDNVEGLRLNQTIFVEGLSKKTNIAVSNEIDYFNVSIKDYESGEVEIHLLDELPSNVFKKGELVVELEARHKQHDVTGRAAILIRNWKLAARPPVFGKHLYFASYSTSGGLELQQPITIKHNFNNDTELHLLDYSNYFRIEVTNAAAGELNVLEIKQLPQDILARNEIFIEIEATNRGLNIPGRTALMIRINKAQVIDPPVFARQIYFVKYSAPIGLLPIEQPIVVSSGLKRDTQLQLLDYSNYFEIQIKNVLTGELELRTKKPLPGSILTKDELVIEIKAENKGLDITGGTGVIVRIVKEIVPPIHPPVFSNHIYFGSCTKNGRDLTLYKTITVSKGLQRNTLFKLRDFSTYFVISKVNYETGELTLESKGIKLPNVKQIILEIEATNPRLTIPGHAVVIINVEQY